MSSIFQSLVGADGRVNTETAVAGILPPGAFYFRGIALSSQGNVLLVPDAGQARNYIAGIAVEQSTGMVIQNQNTDLGSVICSGGLRVSASGTVLSAPSDQGVIHQGVGLQNSGELNVGKGTFQSRPLSAVLIGDSFVAQDTPIVEAAQAYTMSASHFFWANAYAGNRLWVKGNLADAYAGYQGSGGDNTAAVLARISAATALNPDFISVGVGINDATNDIPLSTSISNYEGIVSAITGSGAIPILLTLPPTDNVNSDSRQAAFEGLNSWIRSQSPIAIICEQTDAYIDPNASYSQPKAGYTIDGTHTNSKGAEAAGRMQALALMEHIPAPDLFTENTLLFPNPSMLGEGGVVERNITGVAPNNITITNGSSTDLGGPASKVPRGSGLGEWSDLRLTGPTTYTSYTTDVSWMSYTNNISFGGVISPGDLVQLVWETEDLIAEGFEQRYLGSELRFRMIGATRQWWYVPRYTSSAALGAPPEGSLPYRVIATPVFPFEAGATSVDLFMYAITAAANADVRCRRGRHAIIVYPPYTS